MDKNLPPKAPAGGGEEGGILSALCPPPNLPPLGGGKYNSLVERGYSRVLRSMRDILLKKSP